MLSTGAHRRSPAPPFSLTPGPSRDAFGEVGAAQLVELLVTAGRLVGGRLLGDHREVGGRRVVGPVQVVAAAR